MANKSKDKDKDSDATDAAPAAPESAPEAEQQPSTMTLQQWCAVTQQVPHRTRAFTAQVVNPQSQHTADEWAAQFESFNKTEIK